MKKEEIIKRIIWANKEISNFWMNAIGWAPENAAALLSKSRLDWQISLSHSLEHWIQNENISDGDLILAWANLGALIEGTLKLFLCVHLIDYKSDPLTKMKKGKIRELEPDILMLDDLKLFFKDKQIIADSWVVYIEKIQRYRNAIHAYKHRDIGNFDIFINSLDKYLEFLHEINLSLPYPDDFGFLEIYPDKKFKV